MIEWRRNIFSWVVVFALIPASCDKRESQATPPPDLPAFSVEDVFGKEVSDKQFRDGMTLVFLPGDDESINKDIAECVQGVEEIERLSVNKICVRGKGGWNPPCWTSIINSSLRRSLRESYIDSFIVMYNDGRFAGSLTSDDARPSDIDIRKVRIGLYKFLLGYYSPEELVESHRPEEFIRPDVALQKLGAFLEKKQYQYVLYLNAPNIACGDINLAQYFDRVITSNNNASGVIYFDSSFSQVGIKSYVDNFNISLSTASIIEALDIGISALHKSNCTDKYNFILEYNNSNFARSFYIYANCDSLYSNLPGGGF